MGWYSLVNVSVIVHVCDWTCYKLCLFYVNKLTANIKLIHIIAYVELEQEDYLAGDLTICINYTLFSCACLCSFSSRSQ